MIKPEYAFSKGGSKQIKVRIVKDVQRPVGLARWDENSGWEIVEEAWQNIGVTKSHADALSYLEL